jgi:two-component system OmpR family response regulator
MHGMRLLVVEDDVKLVRALQRGLRREGYDVDVALRVEEAVARVGQADYDAVLLDLMLPDGSGFSVCEALRGRERWVPVLMLTARAEVSDRIRGLDAGADDYIVKPFDFGELLARLRAVIRRGPSQPARVGNVPNLRLDPATHVVTHGGHSVDLTPREFAVLECLAANAGRVVSRQRLLEQVWDGNSDGSANVVDVYVGYLRRKLERPSGRRLIRTVRGVGFLLEPE